MIAVTALGQNCWLIPYGPNTDETTSIKPRIEVDEERGLTGRQSRRPQAMLLRYQLTWTCLMKAEEFFQARRASLSFQDEPLLAPFWPAARAVGTELPVTAGLTVAWTNDWATWAIAPEDLSGFDFYAPLLWGRFAQPVRMTGANGSHILSEWTITEDSPIAAAIQPLSATDATFDTAGGLAAAIFPYVPEVSDPPKSGLATVQATRKAFGPGRQQSTEFYPQDPEQGLQLQLKFTCSAAAFGFLGWLQRRGGSADPIWVATGQNLGFLAADAASGAMSLAFVCAPPVEVGDTIALYGSDGIVELNLVQSIAGTTVGLAFPLANVRPAAATIVAPAILAKHSDKEITIDFRRADTDWTATIPLSFAEVSAEYQPTSDETVGTTIGRLPPGAWLFEIELDYSGATQSWYFTNFEGGVTTPDSQVWEYHDCGFDKLIQSLDLEDDNCNLNIRWWDGCPWENWLPGNLAATGTLTIYRAPVATDGAIGEQVQKWTGTLGKPTRNGAMLKVQVLGANNVFARLSPRQLMSPACGTTFCSARCGQVLANWTFNATVTAIGDNTLTIGSIALAIGGGTPAGFGFQDWFALGFVQLSGPPPLRAEVLGSTVPDEGGNIQLTLGRMLNFEVGQSVTVAPNCDKQAATCQAYDPDANPLGKFNNYLRFRGFPLMPAIDPCFIIPQPNTTPAKK
jgi:hypothetical protein